MKILKKSLSKARKVFFKPNNNKNNKRENINFKNSIVVPYVPMLEKLKQPLKELDTSLIFKYNNKLGQNLTKNKPLQKVECGVYKIPCKNCKQFYIGEAGRELSKRTEEHKMDIKTQKPESGIAEHVRLTDHFFDFKKAEIVYPSKNIVKRHIVESALINTYSKSDLTVNLNTGFAPHNKFLTNHIKEIINLDDFG